MKLILASLALLFAQSAFAEYIQLPVGAGAYVGSHYVQCGSSQQQDSRHGGGSYYRPQVYCSVKPAGGILYQGSASTEREALNNLERYCLSKRQSSRLADHCAEMRQIAICNRQ